ncbi:MAG: GNAT family N-acetyltransferase [Lachnospiraceae bacterium]
MIREARIIDSKEIKDICTNDLEYQCDEQLIELRIANLDKNRECVFVADIDGEIAGFVHVEKYDLLYFQSMANILGLAVSSKFRRQGLGEKLMYSAEEWAKNKGIHVMRLNSGGGRKEAHMFYRNIGFSDEKEQLRFIKEI